MGSSSVDAESVEVVVVGAGWNGLTCAKTYLDFRPSAELVIIDDQETFGGVWCANKIYPSLYAQIKHGLFEYSFYPMSHEGITEDGYISGGTIHTYLNDFAHDFDLVRRTRLRTTVTNVSQLPGGSWFLKLAGKSPIKCRKLIYASGATSHPVIPAWPRSGPFDASILHSSFLGTNLDILEKFQSFTVVGGAKSSYDAVFVLLKAGKKVDWIIRDDGCGPLAIMPPTVFGLVNTMDVVTTRFMMMMGISIMSTDGLGHQFFERNMAGRFFVGVFWLLVNWIADRHAGYSKSENSKKLRPPPHGNGVPHFWKTFHAGDCKLQGGYTVHRTDVESLDAKNTIHLKNGDHIQTDYLILATGFDKSYHVFSHELQHKLGLMPDGDKGSPEEKKWAKLDREADEVVEELFPALCKPQPGLRSQVSREKTTGGHRLLHGPSRHYRRLVVPELAAAGDRSVIFPGFIHTIYTPSVAETQALWGVAFLLGLHDVPSREDMEREVAEWMAWSRKRYVAQGKKHAYAIYDFLPYIDTLLKDLGVTTRRKKNIFSHIFMPSYPRHYKGIQDEYQQYLISKDQFKTIKKAWPLDIYCKGCSMALREGLILGGVVLRCELL